MNFLSFFLLSWSMVPLRKRGIEVEAGPGNGMNLVCLEIGHTSPPKQVNSPIRSQACKVKSASRTRDGSRLTMGLLGRCQTGNDAGQVLAEGPFCCHGKEPLGLKAAEKSSRCFEIAELQPAEIQSAMALPR